MRDARGNYERVSTARAHLERRKLTVPVVIEVEQLVVPLGHNAECILEESHDDQEAANRGEVSAE